MERTSTLEMRGRGGPVMQVSMGMARISKSLSTDAGGCNLEARNCKLKT